MKSTTIVLIALALITFVLLPVVGCKPLPTQTYNYADFARIEVEDGFQIEVVQSNSYSISITGPEDLFNFAQVSKEGETLKIGLAESVKGTKKAKITMPDLYKIQLSGGSRADITGFSSSHDLSVELSGGSRVTGDIIAGDAGLNLSGGSHVVLSGSADDLDVNISGGSHLTLQAFSVSNADVHLSGGSHAVVKVDGTLNVDLSGGSHLRYVGQPIMGDINFSEDSTLSKK